MHKGQDCKYDSCYISSGTLCADLFLGVIAHLIELAGRLILLLRENLRAFLHKELEKNDNLSELTLHYYYKGTVSDADFGASGAVLFSIL